jgi:hypothetical protein
LGPALSQRAAHASALDDDVQAADLLHEAKIASPMRMADPQGLEREFLEMALKSAPRPLLYQAAT